MHPSLHSNSHHQIIYSKFDLQIFYPPPYLCEVWHYKDAKAELIRQYIATLDWEKAFSNTSVNENVAIFNRTILHILKTILFDMKELRVITETHLGLMPKQCLLEKK